MENQIQPSAAALAPLADITQAASIIAKSGLFGVKSLEQAAALMLVAQSEGLHYAQAVQDYDIIQGRPALKSSSMLARFQRAGGCIKWLQRADSVCEAEFLHPQGGSLRVKWDLERAKKAGLAAKEMWLKYPSQMLSARVISEGIRALFPACLNGFYAVEEMQDLDAPNEERRNPAPLPPSKPLVQAAEIVPKAPEAKPDYAVNIAGNPAGLTGEETESVCEWLKSLPNQERMKAIVKKFCPLNKIGSLGKTQVDSLASAIASEFGLTYTPNFFKKNEEAREDF